MEDKILQLNSINDFCPFTKTGSFYLKGIIRPFPKLLEFSVETVDRFGKWHDQTYFVSELPYLQMPGPQS